MRPIQVVLVDDHHIVRQGLRSILDPDPRFIVVGEACNGAEALRVIQDHQPDAVLLDLKLPDISGVKVCEQIVEVLPSTAVLILSAYVDRYLVKACMQAKARGYLLKNAENLRLREHILEAVKGHVTLDPRVTDVLAEYIRGDEKSQETLSEREIEILRLIALGFTNKEIGGKLYLSKNTVKGYVRDILAKLDVHSRVEAVMRAKERGLI